MHHPTDRIAHTTAFGITPVVLLLLLLLLLLLKKKPRSNYQWIAIVNGSIEIYR